MSSSAQPLKAVLLERSISQRRMAEFLHVSVGTVNGWVNGYTLPSADHRRELSKVLGIPTEQLFHATVLARAGRHWTTR